MPDYGGSNNRLTRFFSNPTVGGLGTVVGVIGILIAIYFYFEQKEFRALTYYLHPAKAIIVKADQASKLTATYDNNPVKTDISVAQIAIWNQGKLSIRNNNILKPVVIYMAEKKPILEASIRKLSRDVINLQLRTEEAQKGRISLSWQILEQNDGGIIQLIYAGGPDVDIRIDGVIEGQKEIKRIEFFKKIQPADEQYRSSIQERKSMAFIFMGFGLFFLASTSIIIRRHQDPIMHSFLWVNLIFGTAFSIGVGIYLFLTLQDVGPPFGF